MIRRGSAASFGRSFFRGIVMMLHITPLRPFVSEYRNIEEGLEADWRSIGGDIERAGAQLMQEEHPHAAV